MAYCAVCAWFCETGDGTSRDELNRAMIDHHVQTGHAPIETTDSAEVEPARGRDHLSERPDESPRPSGPPDRSKRPATDRPDWLRKN